MEDIGFYKYIVKSGKYYSIIKDNERYGSYRRLSDVLYERDQLIKAEWDWDKLSYLPEEENIYESMTLPPFIHEYSYIYESQAVYKVFCGRKYHGQFKSEEDALDYANKVNGKVIFVDKKYLVQKTINGKQMHFGTFKTFEDAKKRRDELITKNWIE